MIPHIANYAQHAKQLTDEPSAVRRAAFSHTWLVPATSVLALVASHDGQAFVLTVQDSEHIYLTHFLTILIHFFCYLCY